MKLTQKLATFALLAALLFSGILAVRISTAAASGTNTRMPRYDHIFLIMEENHSYSGVIGNPVAPEFNSLAQTYGLATNYYGAIHPSEGNYVAIVGGNTYGITDDNPYYTHTIDNNSIVNQLEGAGLTWKGYFQSMPYAGYLGVCYPANCKGPLYASKHNGFLNFIYVQKHKSELQKLVPMDQFAQDLQHNQVPNFSMLAPDQCHDMHGARPFCPNPGKQGSHDDNILVSAADSYATTLVNEIMSSPLWSKGNNAIVITWDEGNSNRGCCDANPGGGLVATIVVTNHGPRGVTDNTLYNHYSLVSTIEAAFGLGCMELTCDTKNVVPMIPLFAAN